MGSFVLCALPWPIIGDDNIKYTSSDVNGLDHNWMDWIDWLVKPNPGGLDGLD